MKHRRKSVAADPEGLRYTHKKSDLYNIYILETGDL